jgi:hypothetical protein
LINQFRGRYGYAIQAEGPEKYDDMAEYEPEYWLVLKAFYWHRNRQPREPSNLRRSGPVETSVERRRRRLGEEYEKIGKLWERQRENLNRLTWGSAESSV